MPGPHHLVQAGELVRTNGQTLETFFTVVHLVGMLPANAYFLRSLYRFYGSLDNPAIGDNDGAFQWAVERMYRLGWRPTRRHPHLSRFPTYKGSAFGGFETGGWRERERRRRCCLPQE